MLQNSKIDICDKSILEKKIQKYEKLQNREKIKCVPCNWNTNDYVNFLFLNFKDFPKRMTFDDFYKFLEITKETNISDYTIYSPGGESPMLVANACWEGINHEDIHYYATRKDGVANFKAIPWSSFYDWKPLKDVKKLQEKWKDASWEPENVFNLIRLEFEEKEIRNQYNYIQITEIFEKDEILDLKLKKAEEEILKSALIHQQKKFF